MAGNKDINIELLDYVMHDDIEEFLPTLCQLVALPIMPGFVQSFPDMDQIEKSHIATDSYMDVLDSLSEPEFFEELRVTRTTFDVLVRLLQTSNESCESQCGRSSIPVADMLACTLTYLGNKVTMKEVASRFRRAEGSIFRSFQKVFDILNQLSGIIKWPRGTEMEKVVDEFEQLSGFPGVVGALGISHINICPPEKCTSDFVDKYENKSVNIIAVCDAKSRFTYIATGMAGSLTDQQSLEMCSLGKTIQSDPERIFPSIKYHVLGRGNFNLGGAVLTPYREGDPVEDQANYNAKFHVASKAIDSAFQLLKCRFRKLEKLFVHLRTAKDIIRACCVIHNIALESPNDCFYMSRECLHYRPFESSLSGSEDQSDEVGRRKRAHLTRKFMGH